tara:strand:- start:1007 stop:1168 length:162 start_codon:yes stop_codon:yes gene_type:complete
MSYLLHKFVNEYLILNNDPSSIQACVLEVQKAFVLSDDEAQSAVEEVICGVAV